MGQKGGFMDINHIKSVLKEKKITYDELSVLTGLSLSTIKKILSGVAKYPRIDTVEAIETALGLNIPADAFSIGKAHIPLVGQVVAGVPVESSEYLESYVTVDYPNANEYFALRVKGDSMVGVGIKPNDILIVHKQNYAENGDIIVASINNESTVKRYRIVDDIVFLMPENSKYLPIPVKDNLYIFGKVVEVRSKF